METEATKEIDHIPHKLLSCETRECKLPSQWRYGKGNKRHIIYTVLFLDRIRIVKLEILKAREEPDEIQDLSARTPGLFEGEESKRRGEVLKVPSRV